MTSQYRTFDSPEEFLSYPDGAVIAGGRRGLSRLFRPYQRRDPGVIVISDDSGAPIRSTDRQFNRFAIKLAQEASEAFPPVAEGGFLVSGAPSDFSKLCTVGGVKMTPSNLPPLDNTELLEKRSLRTSPTGDMRILSDAVLAVVHRPRPLASFRMSRISSTTLNQYTSAMPVKQAMIRAMLSDPDHLLKHSERGLFRGITMRYGAFFMYMLVERQQADSGKVDPSAPIGWAPKERLIRDLKGSYVSADKTSVVAGLGLNGWATRNRTAYAMSGPLAYFISALRTSYSGYLEEFHFTWKHRSFQEMDEKIANAIEVRGFDATQMDQHVPLWFLDMHSESLANRVVDPRLHPLLRGVNRMGYVAPPMGEDYPLVLAGGLTPSEGVCVGLASGRSDNPDIGKEWMTAVYLELFFRVYQRVRGGNLKDFCFWLAGTHDVITTVERYLLGEARIKSLNIGDDQVSWITSEADRWFITAMDEDESRSTSLSEFVPIEYERVIMFNGGVLTRTPTGQPRFLPNPVSYLVNWLVPERSAGSTARPFPGAGRLLAQQHYRSNPMIAQVDDLLNTVWSREYADSMPTMQSLIVSDARRHPITGSGLRDVDVLALNDPSVIHYKVDPNDLSPEVRKLILASIPGDEFSQLILPFLNADHRNIYLGE